MKNTTTATRQLTPADMIRLALKMEDTSSADQLVKEMAEKTERTESYIRWWIVRKAEEFEPAQADRIRALYQPDEHKKVLEARAAYAKQKAARAKAKPEAPKKPAEPASDH